MGTFDALLALASDVLRVTGVILCEPEQRVDGLLVCEANVSFAQS